MEDDKQKEQDELNALLNNPDEGDEDDKGKDNPDNQDDDNHDDNGNNNGQDDDAGDDDKNKDEKDKGKNDRWNGKSCEDAIKEVEALVSRIAALEGKKKDKKEEPAKDEKKETVTLPLS